MKSLICFTLLSSLLFTLTHAATFEIRNQCSFTVWAAASPGGGRQLNSGQSWTLNVNPGTAAARIWGRTSCNFDASGRGGCQTGDCGGLLECRGYGSPPSTLAEYALNQYMNQDSYDTSLIEGFNLPMEFSHIGGCKNLRCTADINGQCPNELRAPGGCNNPCTRGPGSCGPNGTSRFFNDRCPDAYSYPEDVKTNTCPGGGNYRVVFCP